MKEFIALVHKDAESAYGVSFPDLPGCFSAADKEEDIEANAAEALTLWFEGRNTDDPVIATTPDDLSRQLADELRDGACLLAIPYNEGT